MSTRKDTSNDAFSAKSATLTFPVEALAVIFCPDLNLGPDTGRMYALIKKGGRFYPLVFVNPDMYKGDTLYLNDRGVLFLASNEIIEATGNVDEEGHTFWKSKTEAKEKFMEIYTQQVYGYLVEEW